MDLIEDTIAHLIAARDHIAKLGNLEETHAKVTTLLETNKGELERVQGELENAKSGLSLVHVKNLRDYEEAIFNKSQLVKELEAKIAAAHLHLETLTVRVASAVTRHKQIEDSIASLRARLG